MGSKIEWTDFTWNPITGCTPVSIGCNNCYARAMHKRLRGMGHWKYENDFSKVTMHWDAFDEFYDMAAKWKKPRKIFICSMSDLFHPNVTDQFIKQVLTLAELYPQHTFQLLTKRARRLPEYSYPENVWVGITVENVTNLERIEFLKKVPAKVKFISFEPFLFDFGLGERQPPPSFQGYIEGINWVIAGGETGIGYRWSFDESDKIKALRNACIDLNIPFFFKQWHKKGDRKIMGDEWNEFPE